MKRWAVREQQWSLTHSRALCQHALVRSGIPEWQVTALTWQMGILRWPKWSAVPSEGDSGPSQTLGKYIPTGCVHIARLREIKRKSRISTTVIPAGLHPWRWKVNSWQPSNQRVHFCWKGQLYYNLQSQWAQENTIHHMVHIMMGSINSVGVQISCTDPASPRGQSVKPAVERCTTLTAAPPCGQLKHH